MELQPFVLSLIGEPLGNFSSLGFIFSTDGQHNCLSLKSLHSCRDGDKPERYYNAGSGLLRCFLTEFFCWVWGATIIRLLLLWWNPMIKLTKEFVLENSWSQGLHGMVVGTGNQLVTLLASHRKWRIRKRRNAVNAPLMISSFCLFCFNCYVSNITFINQQM